MTFYVHIGLHKAGSSSLRQFLHSNREALAVQGYVLPRAGRGPGEQDNVAYELAGRPRFNPEHGRLEDVLNEVDAAPHAILSSAELEFLDLEQVRRLKDAIGERPVRVIAYLRRQDALIASTYVERGRTGAATGPMDDHVRRCLYDPRFDFPQMLLRWASAFGRDSLDVSVIAPQTSGPLLYDDFIDKLGLTARRAALTPLDRPSNPTPGRAHLEIMRRLFARFPAMQRFPAHRLRRIGVAAEAGIDRQPLLRGAGRVELDATQSLRVAARFGAGNAWVAREFVADPAVAQALAFDASAAHPAAELDETSIEAAVLDIIARFDLTVPVAQGRAGGEALA